MMITGDKKLDNIMEIAEAVFACPEAGKYTKSVEEAKYEAIRKTLKTTQYYREHGFMSELVHTIFTKKLEMIKKANTVKDLKEIEKGSLPHFNGNSFMTGPYHIPEEEMILWSLTSLPQNRIFSCLLVSGSLRRVDPHQRQLSAAPR